MKYVEQTLFDLYSTKNTLEMHFFFYLIVE